MENEALGPVKKKIPLSLLVVWDLMGLLKTVLPLKANAMEVAVFRRV